MCARHPATQYSILGSTPDLRAANSPAADAEPSCCSCSSLTDSSHFCALLPIHSCCIELPMATAVLRPPVLPTAGDAAAVRAIVEAASLAMVREFLAKRRYKKTLDTLSTELVSRWFDTHSPHHRCRRPHGHSR